MNSRTPSIKAIREVTETINAVLNGITKGVNPAILKKAMLNLNAATSANYNKTAPTLQTNRFSR